MGVSAFCAGQGFVASDEGAAGRGGIELFVGHFGIHALHLRRHVGLYSRGISYAGRAERFLQKAGVIYEKRLANENPELVAKYGITQAPTLVVISGDSFEKIPNLSNIKAFTERI